MATTFKLYADKMGATDPSTYIGREGDIFYDPDTGALKRSDGTTPGGVAIAGGGGGGLNDVVDDLTPQLGGNLDTNNKQITGHLIPSANVAFDLGTSSLAWRDLYLSGTTINLGGVEISSSGGKIDLPAGSTIGGSAADPVTPPLEAVIASGNTAVTMVDLQGGLKTDYIQNSQGGVLEANTNINVVGSLSATVSIDAPAGSMTANTAQFTTLNTHTIPGGSGTLALVSDIAGATHTSFYYDMGSAPTGTVASSSQLGGGLGTWTEMTFANRGTTGVGPTSAADDPTLSGVTFNTDHFEIPQGTYLINANIMITFESGGMVATGSPNTQIASQLSQQLWLENAGSSIVYNEANILKLPHPMYVFGIDGGGTYNHQPLSQLIRYNTIEMNIVGRAEDGTASNNQVYIALDGNQSENYYVEYGYIHFIKLA